MDMKITSQNIHLLISVLIVIPTGLSYGFKPDLQFELYPKTIDEYNFFKGIMGFYLGFSVLWIFGIVKQNLFKTALITNIIFMLGLGFGRTISMLTDGLPTFGYKFGIIGELLLGFYGIYVLSKDWEQKNNK